MNPRNFSTISNAKFLKRYFMKNLCVDTARLAYERKWNSNSNEVRRTRTRLKNDKRPTNYEEWSKSIELDRT